MIEIATQGFTWRIEAILTAFPLAQKGVEEFIAFSLRFSEHFFETGRREVNPLD